MTTRCLGMALAACLVIGPAASAGPYLSYPPLRPLPTPSDRPMEAGPARFVDAQKGDDANVGSRESPWRTLASALSKAHAGHTLYLRGGIYWETVSAGPQGTADAPVTVRSFPGELAILDGGIRECVEDPANAWEPYAGGGEGEYRTRKAYPIFSAAGNFGDSMVPLRIYGSFVDLRSPSEYEVTGREGGKGVYVGPGVRLDEATGRVHVRLAHTTLQGLGEENYRGETDPRKVPLIITGSETGLELRGAKHVRVRDIVIRGSLTAVRVTGSEGIEFDGVTLYATRHGFRIENTDGLKVTNCALRGFDAPWHPRASGTDVDCFCPLDLVTAESGRNFEFAYNEFTDHHDGFQFGNVDIIRFHHNYVDHFNDDGMDFDLSKLGTYEIYENLISRCLSPLSIHHGALPEGGRVGGVYVFRNIFDMRRGTYSKPPSSPDDPQMEALFNRRPNLIMDHGNPTWPPIYFCHNTVLQTHPPFRRYYASGLGYAGLRQTSRRVLNNIFVHRTFSEGPKSRPGFLFPSKPGETDLQADGNLFWSLEDAPSVHEAQQAAFAQFRKSAAFEESKKAYAPGWTAADQFADPKFVAVSADWRVPTRLMLQEGSPAVNSGVALPPEWPDPLLNQDKDTPDLGAIPLGVEPWRIGIRGRILVCP